MEPQLEYLNRMVNEAQAALNDALKKLADFIGSPENNRFDTLEDAEGKLEDRLRDMAHEDCEGAGNCGADQYKQEFIVGDKHYMATLVVEYNRHDKTYYYIDGTDFTVEAL